MSREAALALWGAEVVERALSDPAPEPASEELARLIEEKAIELRDDAAVARWALALPWARFCAVVRIVAGKTREELLGDD